MFIAYDPAVLEEVVLEDIKLVYASGCLHGMRIINNKEGNWLLCLNSAEKVVNDQKDIFLDSIWKKQ